jgi:ABC-type glycerol-3-phosphate transport system permease component
MVFTFCRRQGRANALGESVRASSVSCQYDVLVERKPKELSLLLGGLQLIAGDLYEAASIDGATGIRKFFAITLPLVTPTLLVALIFRTLDALRVFDIFYIMVGGQGNMATVAVYNQQQLIQFLENTPR